MATRDDLIPVLKRLRLSGLLETLDLRTRQAVSDELALTEFLYRLLNDEVERREAKQLNQRVKRAGFDQNKTIEEFDFAFNANIPKPKIIDLSTCQFVRDNSNVLLVGPTGVGKSHLAQALGHRACRMGYTTQYLSAHEIFTQLRAARADESWDRRMQRLCKVDLLIIDDLGLRPLASDEPVDLYEVIRRRYESGAMIITSNRAVEEWYPLFGDMLMASAAMDRLLHHAEIIVMEGKSFRNPSTRSTRR